jgi:hypothetical protein
VEGGGGFVSEVGLVWLPTCCAAWGGVGSKGRETKTWDMRTVLDKSRDREAERRGALGGWK